jgi:acetoacetyl-CoA synthetase
MMSTDVSNTSRVRPVWVPDEEAMTSSALGRFGAWCQQRGLVDEPGYRALWEWSTRDVAGFWAAVWDYFSIEASTGYGEVVTDAPVPEARWFVGSRLNYVDHVFRNRSADQIAIVDATENAGVAGVGSLTWGELERQVYALRRTFVELGVSQGDAVVGYMPNCPQTVAAFLAAASLGAVWSSCGQDYSAAAATARLAQLRPKVLVTATGYAFAGRTADRRGEVVELIGTIPEVEAVVLVDRVGLGHPGLGDGVRLVEWADAVAHDGPKETTHVEFSTPLWVLFSSGTTGKPKGLVHGHGGVLLEHLKALSLQLDLGPEDRFFWFTSPSWMVWNYLASALLTGASIVTYDGSPVSPDAGALWRLAEKHEVTFLGVSPGYVLATEKAGIHPAKEYDLRRLRILGSSGSNLPGEAYRWIAEEFGRGLQVMSTTGGTDIVSAFAGAVRTVPVWPGEISAPCLGVALDAWDAAGNPVRGSVGELVVTKPMPSMPVGFWGDVDNTAYRAAYFDVYGDRVWRHGDWITITDRGSVVMHGRSDSTLNRNGVRMGSAEIYDVVDAIPEVAESLVVGVDEQSGYWMPLFVVPQPGVEVTARLVDRIKDAVRTGASPRHVPDEVIVAPGIPHTKTGKRLEVPVKRLLLGAAIGEVVDLQSVDDPSLLEWYAEVGSTRHSGEVSSGN